MTKLQTYGSIGTMLLAGAMFRGYQTQTAPTPEGGKRPVARDSVEKTVSGEGPWMASCRYWAVVRSEPSNPGKSSPKVSIKIDASRDKVTSEVSGSKDDDSKTECEASGYGWGIPAVQNVDSVIKPQIHTIIAAVPDPLHSHLALEFDRAIDSFMQAAADHRYLASNYWLPWRDPSTSGASTEPSTSEAREHKRQEQPGLIILKFSPPAPELNAGQSSFYNVVYLFLVGESPATGMDGPQLRNALRYEAYLHEKYDAKMTMADSTRITGPVKKLVRKISLETRNDMDQILAQIRFSPEYLDVDRDPIGQLMSKAKSSPNAEIRTEALGKIEPLKESLTNYIEIGKIESVLSQSRLSDDDVETVRKAIDHLILSPQARQEKSEVEQLKEDVHTFQNDLESVAFIGPRSSGSATSLRQALLCAPFRSPPAGFVGAGTTSTKIASAELNEPNPWQFNDRACPASRTPFGGTTQKAAVPAKNDTTVTPPWIFYVSFGENTEYEEKVLIQSFHFNSPDLSHRDKPAPVQSDKSESVQSDKPEPPPDTAVLVEDNTVFGNASAFPGAETTPPQEKDKETPSTIYIRFPREISLLRNAQPEQKGSSGSQPPSPYLSLSLKDPGSDDMIPKFSNGQTPLSQEAQLMVIERQLQKLHIRHILITASNILDEIFLARELHRACPNATIVFYNGGDLLVERDVDNTPYIGSLTVTPYSLVALDRPSALSRRAFSDSQAAAIYNAASYIFWWGSADSLKPARLTGSFGPNPPDPAKHFPLYVDAIGSDGYYPLGILSPCASDSKQITPDVALRTPTECDLAGKTHTVIPVPEIPFIPSLFWFLLCGLIILLCCIHGAVMLSANYWSPLTRDLAIAYNDQPRRRAVYIHIGISMLCCSALVLAIPYFAFARGYRSDGFALATAVLVLVAAVFAATATLTRTWTYLGHLKGTKPQYPTGLYSLFNTLAVAIILVVLVTVGLVCVHDSTSWGMSYVGLFFSYRFLHPTSGVSPLVPLLLLLLAWYLWAMFQTARLRFSEMNRPRLPAVIDSESGSYFVSDETLGNCTPPLASCLIDNVDCFLITRELARRFTGWPPVWLNFVLGISYIALFLLCSLRLHIQSFEHFLHPGSGLTGFEWLTAILFYPLIMIALSGWLRVLFIWNSLQNGLLEPLERTPLRFAFNRLSEVDWVTMLGQSGLNIQWRDMAHSSESLRQLMNNKDLMNAVCNCREKDLIDAHRNLDTLVSNLRHHIKLESMDLDSEKKQIEKKMSVLESKKGQAAKQQDEIMSKLKEINLRLKEKADLSQKIACYRYPNVPRLNSDVPMEDTVVDLCYIHGIELSYAQMGKLLLENPLLPYWKTKRARYVDSAELNTAKAEHDSKSPEPEDPLYIRLAEEFLAIRYVAFIRTVLVNIRHLMLFVSLAFVLAIVAWNSYPFQPHQQIDWCFTILLVFLTTGFVTVFAQMHRNAILSRITSTTPNELGADFYVRLLTFGAVPVLTWLAYQFPSIGGTIFGLLQPSLQVK